MYVKLNADMTDDVPVPLHIQEDFSETITNFVASLNFEEGKGHSSFVVHVSANQRRVHLCVQRFLPFVYCHPGLPNLKCQVQSHSFLLILSENYQVFSRQRMHSCFPHVVKAGKKLGPCFAITSNDHAGVALMLRR